MELEKAKTRTNYLILLKDTRPSVNYAKDWLGQLFLFPGLVWSSKGFRLYAIHRKMVIECLDPSVSLLLTSEKAVCCKKYN